MRRLIARFPLTATVSALIVWALHFVFVYAAVGLACERPQTLGRAGLDGALLLSTLLALAAVALAGAVGHACMRRTPGLEGDAARRRRFLGASALLLALLALLAILLVAAPMLLLPPCPGWRPA